MKVAPLDDPRCAAGQLPPQPGKKPGSTCREFDGLHPGWAAHGTPLCESELRVSERDCRNLLYDFIDLEQLQWPVLSQALDTQPGGKPGPPMPMAGNPEALQAEITHVLTVWEQVVRAECGLSEPAERGPNAPWHTTVSKRPPLARVRDGHAVARAVAVLSPRLEFLAKLGPQTVQPQGVEDDWSDVAGWEAVLAFSRLHQRARSMLGRTRRTVQLHGDCSECGESDLRRDEPRYEGDPCDVYCGRCGTRWSYDAWETYVRMLVWPTARSAA